MPEFMDRLIGFVDKLPRLVGATLCGLPVALGVLGAFAFPVLFATGLIWEGIVCLICGILAIYFLVYSRLLTTGYLQRKREERRQNDQIKYTQAQKQAQALSNENLMDFELEEKILDDYYSGSNSKEIARKYNLNYKDVIRIIASHESENQLLIKKD